MGYWILGVDRGQKNCLGYPDVRDAWGKDDSYRLVDMLELIAWKR